MFVSKAKVLARAAAIATALAGLALAPACKKEGGEGGAAGSKAAAAKSLSFMPKSASVVMGINVSGASNAGVLAKYKDEFMSQAPKEMRELQEACGMNFLNDISTVMVGMTDDEKGVVVINGKFTQAKIEECLNKAAAKENKQVTMSDEGKLRSYKVDDETTFAYWPGDGIVVMSSNELGGKATLEAVIGGAKLGDGPVMSLINSTKQSSTFWMAGNPSALAKGSPLDGQEITGMALTVNAGDNLEVKALVNFPSEAKAKELAGQAKMMIEMGKGHPMAAQFKDIIEKFKLEADGKAIKAGISLTAADLDKLANFAKSMGGMMR